jgi:hypothetical protein
MRGKTLAGIVTTAIVVVGAVSVAQGSPDPGPLPPLPAEKAKDPYGPAPYAPYLSGTAELPPAVPATDDPMQAVEAFVQRNRKEADEAIKTLTQERDSLRARLQKVEAALGRWKAVAGALEQSQATAAQPAQAEAVEPAPEAGPSLNDLPPAPGGTPR